MLLLLSTWVGSLFLVRFNNFDGLWASIGVVRSYSSHPFLCALASMQWKCSLAVLDYCWECQTIRSVSININSCLYTTNLQVLTSTRYKQKRNLASNPHGLRQRLKWVVKWHKDDTKMTQSEIAWGSQVQASENQNQAVDSLCLNFMSRSTISYYLMVLDMFA